MAYSGWTVSSLAAAYLDLVLAYLLLCCATIAFFTSRLLALFGLHLPFSSSCRGLFVHAPISAIASVHLSLRSRFPFDSSSIGRPRRFEVKILDHDHVSGAEDSARRALQGVVEFEEDEEEELPSGSNVSSCSLGFTSAARNRPPPHPLRRRRQISPPSLSRRTTVTTELSDASDLNEVEKDGVSDSEETDGGEMNLLCTVNKLEMALEEERAVHSALYVELEKERSAAASAADEAMAMILRLQEEKAAIEMDARQYQRMVEDKSVYDEEEMDILKEIIMRRERENYVLEKEVEEYRNIVFCGEGQEYGIQGDWHCQKHTARHVPGRAFHIPTKFLPDHELVGVNKNEGGGYGSLLNLDIKNKHILSGDEEPVFIQNYCHEHQGLDDEFNMECQEKSMLTIASVQSQNTNTEGTFHVVKEGRERDVNNKTDTMASSGDIHGEQSQDVDQKPLNSLFDSASTVLDVHVVNGNLDIDVTIKENEEGPTGGALCFPEKSSSSLDYFDTHNHDTNCTGDMININKQCSEMMKGSSSMDSLCCKATSLDLRRSSTYSIESERHKLEMEVELLRTRLKIIQEGRERLTVPVEHREKENFQQQLLEEFSHQLQAIRKMTEPGQEAALPPCKVQTKKKRCRSVPWELHESM